LQLSIIIINYNVKFFLEQCLSSVVKACKNIEAEILVVDNNSSDGSRIFFANRFPNVYFIWKNENAGFAKANNEALKLAKGEKILFLNPDTIIPEDCFEKCLTFFSENPFAAAIGVRMIDGTGTYLPESKRGFPSLPTSFYKMSGLTKLFPRSKIFAKYYLGHLPENEITEADVLSGAFIMTKKKVLDITGSFDESFFMYAEDIDLSFRIQKAGYKNYYFPETTIIHFKGESIQRNSLQHIKIFYGAMLLFAKKHYIGRTAFAYKTFINAAKWLKLISASIKSIFQSNSLANTNNILARNVLVISDAVDFDKISISIKNTAQGLNNVERFNLYENYTGSIAQLSNWVKSNADSEVFFCENGLSFVKIIDTMEYLSGSARFYFHAAGSASFVGSGSKNSTGIFVELKN
jgi:GT2 family glycosyltransferase